jgi:hypothetical protein
VQFPAGTYNLFDSFTANLNVSAWADQSTNAYNVFQATVAEQPQYFGAGGPNNVPHLTFGSNDYLLLDNTITDLLTSGNPRTVLVACQATNGTGGTLVCFRRSTSGGATVCSCSLLAQSSTIYVYSDGRNSDSNASYGGTIPTDVPIVLDWELATSSIPAFAINGVAQSIAQGQGAMSADTGADGFTVGNREDAVPYQWPGDIYEVVVYNRVLAASELTRVRRYLGSRYAVSVP